ncbi:MAG: hypothetical protein LUQ07_04855 [Methanospirillum sp.]|nr:hypothetical protein [Methanospirillum sp.]
MSRYLHLISLLEARTLLRESFRLTYHERSAEVTQAYGYISAYPVFSRLTVPCCPVSLMDGYALRSSDTHEAGESHPVLISSFSPVHTGQQVPGGFDAVIMQEDVRIADNTHIGVLKPVRPGQHIQKTGSEMQAGRMILPAGHLITPQDIGYLLSYGIVSVPVKVIVAGLVPTGDELVEPSATPGPGEVIASNCQMMAAYFRNLGIEPIIYPNTPDDPERIRVVLDQAAGECDFIIVSGGSSTGKRDHTHAIVEEMGRIIFHGVAIRPGKTVLAGLIGEKPVFGVPGVPAGTVTALRELVTPWLAENGLTVQADQQVQVILAESIPSDPGTDDFVPLIVGRLGGRYTGISSRGSGSFVSGIRSNGILHIPRKNEGFEAGKTREVRLVPFRSHPDGMLIFSGIYDPVLGYLDQFLRAKGLSLCYLQTSQEKALYTVFKGNLHGGIIRRPCIGGHLILHPPSSFIPENACLLAIASAEYLLVSREGGDGQDLTRYRYPSLPSDSAVRIMLDAYFTTHTIDTASLQYHQDISGPEERIVAGIRNREIDAGPCSSFLARASGLLGPVIGEQSIDLVIKKEYLETEEIALLMSVIMSGEWREYIRGIPGYSAPVSGEVTVLSKETP